MEKQTKTIKEMNDWKQDAYDNQKKLFRKIIKAIPNSVLFPYLMEMGILKKEYKINNEFGEFPLTKRYLKQIEKELSK